MGSWITLTIMRRGLPNTAITPSQITIKDDKLVSRLKSDIETSTGILVSSQILWFRNSKLVNGRTLRNSGLTDGETVELQESSSMRIYFFRATLGVAREETYVLRSETLGEVKTTILGASEVPKYDTQIGGGTTLVEPTRDNTNIATLGVDDDTIIRFHARADGG